MNAGGFSGTWSIRLLIRFLTVLLGLLIYLLFGFLIHNIKTIEGPSPPPALFPPHTPASLDDFSDSASSVISLRQASCFVASLRIPFQET